MLKPAMKYVQQINDNLISTWYDPKYNYYLISRDLYNPSTDGDTKHEFVSVDENDMVLAYIEFVTYANDNTAGGWELVSFIEPSNIINAFRLMDDLLYLINLAFNIEDKTRLEFRCIIENPAIKSYRKFIEKFGGVEIRLRQYIRIKNKLHDEAIFEILKEEFDFEKFNIYRRKVKSKLYKMIERLSKNEIQDDNS